jgi:hypothetical protein
MNLHRLLARRLEAGRPVRVDEHAAGVDAPLPQRLEHEPAEHVVADDGGEHRPEPEPRGAAREDRARTADREACLLHQLLDLPERGLDVLPGEDQVRVAVAEDEHVEVGHRVVATIAPWRASLSSAATSRSRRPTRS